MQKGILFPGFLQSLEELEFIKKCMLESPELLQARVFGYF
jgi:hypothetical protein